MKTGRPPKPMAILKLQGTYNPTRHGGRGRDVEIVPTGSLINDPPPASLSARQQELWMDISGRAGPELLRLIDREMFAEYVILVDQHERANQAQQRLDRGQELPLLTKGPTGLPIESPYLGIMNRCVLLMTRLQAEMGFTPSGRARIAISRRSSGMPPMLEGKAEDGWGALRDAAS